MARAASLMVVSAALLLCLCGRQSDAFWLPSWASWYKKPEVATAYSVGSYPAPVESPPQQFSGPTLYSSAQAVPVAVPYPVPMAAGPHLQMPPNAGQLSLSSYSVGVSSGGNSVASDAGGGVGVSVGGMQLVPCWCSVARGESEDAPAGLGSGPAGAGGAFSVQAAQPAGN